MRVIHILYRLMPSGAEKMLADAADLFKANGIEGYIFIIDKENGPYYDELKRKGYQIFRTEWSMFRKHLLEFARICIKGRIDIVQIHTIRGFFGFSIAARIIGVSRIIKIFHGMFYPKDKIRYLWHMFKRHMCRIMGVRFVAISKSVQKNELSRYSLPTELVWNWVDDRMFPLTAKENGLSVRHELEIPDNAFVILSVGNCHVEIHSKVKNHELILQALSLLPADIRSNVYYIHAGKEMENMPERRLAKKLGIDCQTRFLGSRDDVSCLMAAANLFVMSSVREGLGNAVIEALLSGRHVLLTDVPGLVDFKDVACGVDYAGLDPSAYSAAIQRLYHEITWTNGDQEIRRAAQKTFSMAQGVAAMKRIYEGVV